MKDGIMKDGIITGNAGGDILVGDAVLTGAPVMGDIITGFHVGGNPDADILHISDLLSGMGAPATDVDDLAVQVIDGYLMFHVEKGEGDTATVTLGIQDGDSGSTLDMQGLATIHMAGVVLGDNASHHMQDLLSQLIGNDAIKF